MISGSSFGLAEQWDTGEPSTQPAEQDPSWTNSEKLNKRRNCNMSSKVNC